MPDEPQQLKPITLVLARKKVTQPNGQAAINTQIVDKDTGRPIQGLIGGGVKFFAGVMFLELQTTVYVEQPLEDDSHAGIVLPPSAQNGRF